MRRFGHAIIFYIFYYNGYFQARVSISEFLSSHLQNSKYMMVSEIFSFYGSIVTEKYLTVNSANHYGNASFLFLILYHSKNINYLKDFGIVDEFFLLFNLALVLLFNLFSYS